MRICVLQSSYEGSTSCFKEVDDVKCDPSYFFQPGEHTWEHINVKKSTAVQQVKELANKGYDCIINLCDGGFDEDRAGIEVVHALERYNIPFTGASSNFYEPSKETMKLVAYKCGVKTPMFVFAYNEKDIQRAAKSLQYPLIVKHYNGSGSVGMTKESKVETPEKLFEMANKMIATFGGALIEEFIEGKEYTVLVAENPDNPSEIFAFQPVECRFGKGETFKHFDLKWVDYDNFCWIPVEDQELAEKLKEMSKKVFVGLNGVGYGRTDIRVNNKGEPYFLEMNPNCGIFYSENMGSADFILLNDPITHKGFANLIVKIAIARHLRLQKKYELQFTRDTGYGMYANRDIDRDEVIIIGEDRPIHIVSKSRGSHQFINGSIKQSWLKCDSYALAHDVWCTLSENAADWKPINHSCDPTAWFVGLDIVARKEIRQGDEITIDYATLVHDQDDFECKCGAEGLCRGVIHATDYKLPFVEERYGDHLSMFLKVLRSQQSH